jgi:hypothetical protein
MPPGTMPSILPSILPSTIPRVCCSHALYCLSGHHARVIPHVRAGEGLCGAYDERTPAVNAARNDEYTAASLTVVPSTPQAPWHIDEDDAPMPLPGWLKTLYFVFPIVLYIPDAIFNFYVYSDGATMTNPNPLLAVLQFVLWGFLSVGLVGMAYLLSVLAPWHWRNHHGIQAVLCIGGVLFATAITTWNSLAFRSTTFKAFPTDEWVYAAFPNLRALHLSLTMVLIALAPPMWGLYWALVQPIEHRRNLTHLAQSHQERLLKVQHEAEMKRARAEANASVREAQLKGMAQTAAAARQQFLTRRAPAGQPALATQEPNRQASTLATLATLATTATTAREAQTQAATTLLDPTPPPARKRSTVADAVPIGDPLRQRRLADGVTPPHADLVDSALG